jgi:putative Ca2+/H+ antiporter (TMEM165/GDT1 family)
VIDRLDRAATLAGRLLCLFAIVYFGGSIARVQPDPAATIAVALATAYLAVGVWLLTGRSER